MNKRVLTFTLDLEYCYSVHSDSVQCFNLVRPQCRRTNSINSLVRFSSTYFINCLQDVLTALHYVLFDTCTSLLSACLIVGLSKKQLGNEIKTQIRSNKNEFLTLSARIDLFIQLIQAD